MVMTNLWSIVDEMITTINAAADFEDSLQPNLGLTTHPQMGRQTWVTVKMTAFLASFKVSPQWRELLSA